MKDLATELTKKTRFKVGEIVYKHVTEKNKDKDYIGKSLSSIHSYLFGSGVFMTEESILIEKNEKFFAEYMKHGLIWKSSMVKNSFNWIELSSDAVDTLNELQLDRLSLEQIHKDLPRTFPSLKLAQEASYQLSLRKILVAIANYLPDIGYVQGLNLIVGFCLFHFTSEFECFQFIISLLCGRDFKLKKIFSKGLPNLLSFMSIVEIVLEDLNKNIFLHFIKIGLSQFIFVYQWILTLFTYNMPFKIVTQVWTCFIQEGWSFIIKCCIFLIIKSKQQLLQSDNEKCLKILQIAPTKVDDTFISNVKTISLLEKHIIMINDVVLNNISISR